MLAVRLKNASVVNSIWTLLGEVTPGLPWRRVFQRCLHHETSVRCFSSAAERLDMEGRESCTKRSQTLKENKAVATGTLLKLFLSMDSEVSFVQNETNLVSEVVSEHAVKVRQSVSSCLCMKTGHIGPLLLDSSPKGHLLRTLFLWSGSWPLLPTFWVPKREDISVATNRLEMLLRVIFGWICGLWILLE